MQQLEPFTRDLNSGTGYCIKSQGVKLTGLLGRPRTQRPYLWTEAVLLIEIIMSVISYHKICSEIKSAFYTYKGVCHTARSWHMGIVFSKVKDTYILTNKSTVLIFMPFLSAVYPQLDAVCRCAFVCVYASVSVCANTLHKDIDCHIWPIYLSLIVFSQVVLHLSLLPRPPLNHLLLKKANERVPQETNQLPGAPWTSLHCHRQTILQFQFHSQSLEIFSPLDKKTMQ